MKLSQTACLLGLGLWTSIGATLLIQPARSHGAHINYDIAPSIEVQAQYESGEPMAQAQVAVFTPSSPETPWQTGLTDEAGHYSFSPDTSQAGDWEVQVRQAGHGSIITIPVNSDGAMASATGNALSPAQKLLMTGLGLWGLLGTGLYFSNRSKVQASQANSPPTANRHRPASQDEARADADTSSVEPPVPV